MSVNQIFIPFLSVGPLLIVCPLSEEDWFLLLFFRHSATPLSSGTLLSWSLVCPNQGCGPTSVTWQLSSSDAVPRKSSGHLRSWSFSFHITAFPQGNAVYWCGAWLVMCFSFFITLFSTSGEREKCRRNGWDGGGGGGERVCVCERERERVREWDSSEYSVCVGLDVCASMHMYLCVSAYVFCTVIFYPFYSR